MRYRFWATAICFVIATLTSGITSAAERKSGSNDDTKRVSSGSVARDNRQGTKVTTEFGLGIQAGYNWFAVQPLSEVFTPNIKMRLSYGATLQFRLNIGRSFGIQPEVSYARTTLKINDRTNNFHTKANSNIVQVPLLLSLRVGRFRFNAGPVFTLMDDTSYNLTSGEEVHQMTLGKLHPTVTYAAGVSVKLSKIMILDLRYADQFTQSKVENQYLWTLDQNKQPKAQSFRTSCRSVQLRYGIVF